MAKNNDISITRTLMSIQKTLAKSMILFFLLAGILFIVTINDANINANSYTINENTYTTIKTLEFDHSVSYEIYMFPINQPGPGKIHLVIEKQLLIGGNETVLDSINEGFMRTMSFDEGSYVVRALFIEDENMDFDIGDYTVEMVFGTAADLNFTLFGITVLFIVIFSLSLGFFFALLPFTVAAMIISAVNSSENYREYERKNRQSRREARRQASARNEELANQEYSESNRNQVEGSVEPGYYSSTLNIFDPESYISRFTRTEWILFGFMFFFLLIFFVEFEGVGLFFALGILAWIIYRVNEKEKTKHRILILLSRTNETSIAYLATQTDKSFGYVQDVLQIMILDEGYPISMDGSNGIVRTLGDLSPFLSNRVQNTYQNASGPATFQTDNEEPSNDVEVEENDIDLESSSADRNYSYCSNCGEQLPEFTQYCYICGTKQA